MKRGTHKRARVLSGKAKRRIKRSRTRKGSMRRKRGGSWWRKRCYMPSQCDRKNGEICDFGEKDGFSSGFGIGGIKFKSGICKKPTKPLF